MRFMRIRAIGPAGLLVTAVTAGAIGPAAGSAMAGTGVPERAAPTLNGQLFGVAATSASNAWAVGAATSGKTIILHWDGSTWARVPSPTPAGIYELSAVAATSASNAWAVGGSETPPGKTFILHWNGTAWTRVMSPDPAGTGKDNDLSGVATTASNTAWAVGSFDDSNNNQQALLLRWDGSSWQQVQIPTSGDSSGLSGVGASSSGNAWAVGTDVSGTTGQTLALHCS